jgi:hypothetical protein
MTVAWRPCAGGVRHPRTDIRGLLAAPKKGVNGNGVPVLQPNAANLPMRKECLGYTAMNNCGRSRISAHLALCLALRSLLATTSS